MTKKKDPKDLLPAGRPCVYKPEYCEQVFELLKKGKARAQICHHLGIDRATLAEWAEKFPLFSRAIAKGIESAENWWIELGLENIDNKTFNSRIYELNMMNRFGWNKKNEMSGNLTITHEQSLKELE